MTGLPHEAEYDFLSLLIRNPSLIENTVLKSEYFHSSLKVMFNILKKEYDEHKSIILDNLKNYPQIDLALYAELYANDVYYTNETVMFNELEKTIINNYKTDQYKIATATFVDDCEGLYQKLTEINDINYCENDYVKAKDIFENLNVVKQQVKLGYPKLDSSLNLSKGDFLILSAGTGVGKTAFALNLLSKLSNDYQCVYFNMEMSKNILFRRLCAIETNITLMGLNDIHALDEKKKNILKADMRDIEKRKIILVSKSLTIEEIKKTIASLKTTKHIIAFIDHIGLVKARGNSLYEKMTTIAKELRAISMNYNCTLIGLCQLSRESQKNETVPKLQDLRDSGEIEQSARKVLMLYNVSPDSKDRYHDIQVIIAKNDDGDKNIKNFQFDRYTQIFRENM